MKTAVIVVLLAALAYGGPAGAQDLPPDILADQYLLEAAEAMEAGDTQAALQAFGKIEALDVQPPLEFLYFYGKLLVENGTAFEDVLKGQSLLKQYVLNIEKDSEHYTSTLKLLSVAGGKLAELDTERRAEEEARRQAEAKRQAETKRRGEEEARRQARLKTLPRALRKQMVTVQGGAFRMGCKRRRDQEWIKVLEEFGSCDNEEKPAHRVRLSSFELSKYEVTQELWEAVTGENPSRFEGCARCPVEQVSWNDVQAFLRKLNAQTGERYRLPTEAEWEYAARGGQQSRGHRFAGSNIPDSVAWYNEGFSGNSDDKTHPVGQKQPNELGLYDMSGNVGEWVQDCWHDSYRGAPRDSRAWETGGDCGRRVVRGGSWAVVSSSYVRAAYRGRSVTGHRSGDLGFRIVRTLTP